MNNESSEKPIPNARRLGQLWKNKKYLTFLVLGTWMIITGFIAGYINLCVSIWKNPSEWNLWFGNGFPRDDD